MTVNESDFVPRLDHTIIAQVRELESVRPGLLLHLIGVFDRTTTQLLTEVAGRIAAGELETLRIAFHSLKGSAASLGAQRLSAISGLAERAAGGDSDAGKLGEIVVRLRDEVAAVLGELAQVAQNAG